MQISMKSNDIPQAPDVPRSLPTRTGTAHRWKSARRESREEDTKERPPDRTWAGDQKHEGHLERDGLSMDGRGERI